jgi:hypothetical protein
MVTSIYSGTYKIIITCYHIHSTIVYPFIYTLNPTFTHYDLLDGTINSSCTILSNVM